MHCGIHGNLLPFPGRATKMVGNAGIIRKLSSYVSKLFLKSAVVGILVRDQTWASPEYVLIGRWIGFVHQNLLISMKIPAALFVVG
jgi:hypothetical protein